MSGGHWGYMQHRLRERAEEPSTHALIMEALADAEQICDWALSGDTGRKDGTGLVPQVGGGFVEVEFAGAESELFDRMVTLFDALEGRI